MPAILQVTPPSPRGSRPIPTWSRSLVVTCTNDLPTTSAVTRRPRRFRPVPHGPASGGGKSEGNPGCHLTRVPPTYSPRSSATPRVLQWGDRPKRTQDSTGQPGRAADGWGRPLASRVRPYAAILLISAVCEIRRLACRGPPPGRWTPELCGRG